MGRQRNASRNSFGELRDAQIAAPSDFVAVGDSQSDGWADSEIGDLLRFDGQGQAAFGPNFQAAGNGFADVGQGFIAGLPLADAAGD